MSVPFYRIRIHSHSVIRGTWREGSFIVHMPETFDNTKQWQIAVESFHVKGFVIAPFLITCPQIRQDNSYNTMSKNHDIHLLSHYGGSYQRDITFDSIGIPIKDPNFLQSKYISIRISDLNGEPIAWDSFGTDPNWLLTLVIWPAKTA